MDENIMHQNLIIHQLFHMCKVTRTEATNRLVVFRLGKLLFGVHGLTGIVSLVLTIASLFQPSMTCILVVPSQLCNLFLVQHARSLLHQVPKSTEIFSGIVAPHKEAFLRTILVMQYLIVRILLKCCKEYLQIKASYFDNVASILVLWHWYPLIPSFSSDWRNGNTWIFVVPIFLGITGDVVAYFAYRDPFNVKQLLLGEILGLCLAFGFTLGFRGYIPMSLVYFGAAFSVWTIIEQGMAAVNR